MLDVPEGVKLILLTERFLQFCAPVSLASIFQLHVNFFYTPCRGRIQQLRQHEIAEEQIAYLQCRQLSVPTFISLFLPQTKLIYREKVKIFSKYNRLIYREKA